MPTGKAQECENQKVQEEILADMTVDKVLRSKNPTYWTQSLEQGMWGRKAKGKGFGRWKHDVHEWSRARLLFLLHIKQYLQVSSNPELVL